MKESDKIFTGTAIRDIPQWKIRGKEDNFSFEQIELAFYEEHYGNYVMKQNERHGV